MSTPTDIYTYPENATPLELARYEVAVREAYRAGQPIIDNTGDNRHWASEPSRDIFHQFKVRIARPKIAEGHNPDKLTEAQVGVQDGWRLLRKEEVGKKPGFFAGTQWWHSRGWSDTDTWGANETSCTLRTKNPPGHYLPKPDAEPVNKLVPWTFETAPKGCVLVRHKRMTPHAQLIVSWGRNAANVGCGDPQNSPSYYDLLEGYEHSLDSGKTWLPCGTEAAK